MHSSSFAAFCSDSSLSFAVSFSTYLHSVSIFASFLLSLLPCRYCSDLHLQVRNADLEAEVQRLREALDALTSIAAQRSSSSGQGASASNKRQTKRFRNRFTYARKEEPREAVANYAAMAVALMKGRVVCCYCCFQFQYTSMLLSPAAVSFIAPHAHSRATFQ